MKEKEIIIKGKKISYFDEGKGTTILMLHGGFVTKESYLAIINILKKKYRLVALDFPGHGGSEPLEKNNFKNYLKVINEFIKQLKLKNFHIMGSSFGGTLAVMYASQKKVKVKKIVLQAPVIIWKQIVEHPKMITISRVLCATKPGKLFFYHGYLARIRTDLRVSILRNTPKKNKKVVKKLIKILLKKLYTKSSRDAMLEFAEGGLYIDLTKNLSKIKNETLLMWGRKDRRVNRKWKFYISDRMPNTRYLELNPGTHTVIGERYRTVSKEMDKFFSSSSYMKQCVDK